MDVINRHKVGVLAREILMERIKAYINSKGGGSICGTQVVDGWYDDCHKLAEEIVKKTDQ